MQADGGRSGALAIVVALAGIAACWRGLAWVGEGVARGDGLTGLLVAGLALALVARDLRPRPAFPAWAVALGALSPGLAVLARARIAPLDVFDGLALAGTVAGIAGMWGAPRRAVAALLGVLVLALPVGDVADAILGWPLRVALARVAAEILAVVAPGGMSAGTAIAVEGGVAHVDVPCAGLRGLWSLGAVLLLGALWTRSRLDARWAAAVAGSGAVFLVANLIRIVAVVGLGHVAGWPLVADVVHQPLGIFGFAAAAGLGVWMLRDVPPAPERPAARPRWSVAVLAAWGAASLVHPAAAAVAPEAGLAAPPGLQVLAASAPELAFAAEHGASVLRLGVADPPATVALVTARSWLAHHVPRQCLEAAGWTVDADRPAVIGGDVRLAHLTRGGRRATAVWWFQSADRATDDVTARILDGLAGGGTWVLVSVLVDGARTPEDPELTALTARLRAHVTQQLTEREAR